MMRKASSSIGDETQPLDSEEQDKVIKDLHEEAEAQSSQDRAIFYFLFLCIGAILLSCLVYSFLYPFDMSHQAAFRDLVPHGAFQIYYVFSAICFFIAALVVKKGFGVLPPWVKLVGLVLSIGTSAAWAAIFWIHSVTSPSLLWLPLVNVLGVLLALYVDRDSDLLKHLPDALNASKYEFKKV